MFCKFHISMNVRSQKIYNKKVKEKKNDEYNYFVVVINCHLLLVLILRKC